MSNWNITLLSDHSKSRLWGTMQELHPKQQKPKASLTCESEVEEFLLTWDNHQKNASEAFSGLRNDEFFSDVTLACEDQQFKAHKVVLAASSLFFEQVLKSHKHPNPLIFLMGVEVGYTGVNKKPFAW